MNSKRISRLKKNKKKEKDYCNLCKKWRRLSMDHIPPKGGIEIFDEEITDLYENSGTDQYIGWESRENVECSQSGLKFRSLCKKCNSMLGVGFDPDINKLNTNVQIIYASIYTPLQQAQVAQIKTNPLKIAKGIIGHIIAARNNLNTSPYEEKLRDWFWNDDVCPDEEINIYYWFYPHPLKIIARDLSISFSDKTFFSQVLKYYPLAFWVTDKKVPFPIFNLMDYIKNQDCNIPLSFDPVLQDIFPELPDKDRIIM
jgi:hypothetical protein